jgi:single-strand DNA-binding protein
MSDLNRVTLSGRLVADPDLRYLPSGTAVANLRLASNRTWTGDGAQRADAVFVDVEVYGKSAESLSQHKQKGAFILVDGRLRQHSWEKDGQRHSRLSVVADQVGFGPNSGTRIDAHTAGSSESPGEDDVPF